MMYKEILLAFMCIFVLISSIDCFGLNYWKLRQKVEEARRHKARQYLKQQFFVKPLAVLGSPYVDQYMTQPLDHFDPFVKGTYQQRYWVNADHWDSPHGPIFLFIGGEGALSSLEVQTGEHVDLAKKYKALVLAVEHRYYGESINKDGLQLKEMQYLSSQQALADLASFHDYISAKNGLTDKNTWVCFGGSYPGALSAWFRLKYPHLVYGAIASSAPVRAKVNFEGYNDVVAASLSDPIVNGSVQCALNVKEAFKTVDLMLCDHKYEKLAEDFDSCKPLASDQDAIYQFTSNLADVFMGTVQYNNEAPGMSVSTICNTMTQSSDAYENLKALNQQFLNETWQKCADNSWASFISQVSDTNLTVGGVGLRQWLYQTCTQFGYYQTCNSNSTCLFSHHQSLGPNLDICQDVFNMSSERVAQQVRFTNDYYGSDQPKGTRIVFVNGSIDPWHALSVLEDLSATETAIFIPGTAHCANMHSDHPSDPPALRNARKQIDKQIGEWLEARGHATKKTSQKNANNILHFQRL